MRQGGRLGNQDVSCLPLDHACLFFQPLSRRKKRTLFIMVSGDGGGRCSPTQGRDRRALPGPSPLLSLTLVPFADYQTLRIGGLVFAVVLFSVGILLILSEYVCSSVHSLRTMSVAVKHVAYSSSLSWRGKEPVYLPSYLQNLIHCWAHNRCSVKQRSMNEISTR